MSSTADLTGAQAARAPSQRQSTVALDAIPPQQGRAPEDGEQDQKQAPVQPSPLERSGAQSASTASLGTAGRRVGPAGAEMAQAGGSGSVAGPAAGGLAASSADCESTDELHQGEQPGPAGHARRIFVDSADWRVTQVDRLTTMCLGALVKGFEKRPSALRRLPRHLKGKLIAQLPTNLPLEVVTQHIDDSGYWERRCRAHFRQLDPTQTRDRAWKSVYFEKLLQLELEAFSPRRKVPTGDYAADMPLAGVATITAQELGPAFPGSGDMTMIAGGAIDAVAEFSARSVLGTSGAGPNGGSARRRLLESQTHPGGTEFLAPSYFTAYAQLLPLLRLAAPHVEHLSLRQLRPLIPYTVQELSAEEAAVTAAAAAAAASLSSSMLPPGSQRQNAPGKPAAPGRPSTKAGDASARRTSGAVASAQPKSGALARSSTVTTLGPNKNRGLAAVGAVQGRSPWAFPVRDSRPVHPLDLTGLKFKDSDPRLDHMDVQLLLGKLPRMQSLSVFYGVQNLGLYAAPQLYGMTLRDATGLADALRLDPPLQTLDLSNSGLDSDLVVVLADALASNTRLQTLRLSHNAIGSVGAQALAKVLASPRSALKTLRLANCAIGHVGAIALAQALVDCSPALHELDLSLNKDIGDFGGQSLLRLLMQAPRLQLRSLNLSGTRGGLETAVALAALLKRNLPTPLDINVSCNAITQVAADSYTYAALPLDTVCSELDAVVSANSFAAIQRAAARLEPSGGDAKIQLAAPSSNAAALQASLSHIVGQLMLQGIQSNKHVVGLRLQETSISPNIVSLVASVARSHQPSRHF